MRTPEEMAVLVEQSEKFTPPAVRAGMTVCYHPHADAAAELAHVARVRPGSKGIALLVWSVELGRVEARPKHFVRHRDDPLSRGDPEGYWAHTEEFALLDTLRGGATQTLARLEAFRAELAEQLAELKSRGKNLSDRCNLIEGKFKTLAADVRERLKAVEDLVCEKK